MQIYFSQRINLTSCNYCDKDPDPVGIFYKKSLRIIPKKILGDYDFS